VTSRWGAGRRPLAGLLLARRFCDGSPGRPPATPTSTSQNFHETGRRLDLRPARKDPRSIVTSASAGVGYEGRDLPGGRDRARRCRPLQPVVLPAATSRSPGGGAAARVAAILRHGHGLVFALEVPYRGLRPADAAAAGSPAHRATWCSPLLREGPLFAVSGAPPFDFRTGRRRRPGRLCGWGHGRSRGTAGRNSCRAVRTVDPGAAAGWASGPCCRLLALFGRR